MRRLSDTDIDTIKSLYKGGATQTQLSQEYGVSRASIQNYIKGYNYSNLKRKRYADLTEEEWSIVAKDNHKRISQRPDAVQADEHRWNIDA